MILSLLEQFEIVSLLPLNIFCFDFSATNLLLINIFTLFGNLIGLISYSFTVTSLIIVTFALSFSIFIGINIIGFQRHKAKILSLVITVNIFLVIYCVPYIDLVVNTMDTKFFSYLHCDSPNWEVENIKPIGQFSSLELGVLFILVLALIIVFLYFIWLIYSSKKRRTLLQVVFDKYIYLFMSALNKTLPRRVIYITGGFGSLLVRVLFYYNLINIKSAIVLAFILPFMSFAFF
jgi:F0F1-type ATP synthase membrane subunit a